MKKTDFIEKISDKCKLSRPESKRSIAEYYVSRATLNITDGTYFYAHASGPDESSIGDRNASVYVAVTAQRAIANAAALGSLLKEEVPEMWPAFATNISVLLRGNDSLPYSPHFWHPEFEDFHFGDHIKQADALMLYYPHMYAMPEGVLKNDLYSCTGGGLPTRTTCGFQQMTAMSLVVALRDTGDEAVAEQVFLNLTDQSTEGPFCMWMEQTNRTKSGEVLPQTSKAPNYLTTPGNWLQSAWAGFGGLRLNRTRLELHSPRPLPGSTGLSMLGIMFRGHTLDIRTLDSGALTIKLRDSTSGSRSLAVSPPGAAAPVPLSPGGAAYAAASGVGVTIIAEVASSMAPALYV